MNWTRRTLPLLILLASLPLASHSVGELDAHDWIAPLAAAPGLEIEGNPHLWQRANAKALDPVFDGATGQAARGDLMGFYFDQEVDRLSMRVNLYPTASAEAAQARPRPRRACVRPHGLRARRDEVAPRRHRR